MKILVIALSGIGDALIFTPALKLMKEALPDAEIDLLTMLKGVQDIYSGNPNVNKILFFDFMNEGSLKSLNYVLAMRGNYDVTINIYPSNRKEYNIINFLIGAKKRVAVNYLRKDFLNFGWLNNVTIKENDSLHNAQTNIKLVERFINKIFDKEPPFELYLNKDVEKASANILQQNEISDKDLVSEQSQPFGPLFPQNFRLASTCGLI